MKWKHEMKTLESKQKIELKWIQINHFIIIIIKEAIATASTLSPKWWTTSNDQPNKMAI